MLPDDDDVGGLLGMVPSPLPETIAPHDFPKRPAPLRSAGLCGSRAVCAMVSGMAAEARAAASGLPRLNAVL